MPLLHGGEVVLGHRAAHDLLAELELLGVARLKAHPHVAELAVAAGLLLVAALHLHLLADLLAVGHPGLGELGVHAEAALQPGENHVHLHVAGAGDHHLAGFGVVDPVEGQILLVQADEAGGDLVLLALGLGGDSHGVAGLGEGNGLQLDHLAGIGGGCRRSWTFSILPMAPMSPHSSSLTSSAFLPFITYRRPSFSVARAGIDQLHARA